MVPMVDRVRLVGRMVERSMRDDRRTAVLSAVLVALPIAAVTLASVWLNALAPVALVVASLVWVALSVFDPLRATLSAQLWLNGGRWGTRVLLVMVQAVGLGCVGTATGLAVGVAAAWLIASTTGGRFPSGGWIAGVAAAGIGGAMVAGMVSSVRAVRVPRLPALEGRTATVRLRWWWLVICPALLWAATYQTASQARSFWDLEMFLWITSPLAVAGTVGLASASLRLLPLPQRWVRGPAWFAFRSVGRDRRRTGPMAGLIAVVVGLCAIGVIFSASFAEREQQAASELEQGHRPAWIERDDDSPDVQSLGASGVIMQQARDRWLFASGVALFLVPAIGTSVALSASARRRDDQLVSVQGAEPSWMRWTNGLEAFLMTGVAVVVGTLIALTTVYYGFSIYNESTRFETRPPYPPVPFVVPWAVILVLVLLLPLLSGVLAAFLTPADDAVELGLAAEASAPT